MIALLVAGCLQAPPDPIAGDDGDRGGDDGPGQPDGGTPAPDGPEGAGGCVAGSELDLVWVSEVAFDLTGAGQHTLPGLMILVNAGPDPIQLDSFTVMPPEAPGALQAEFVLTGAELVLLPGEAMGELNISAAAVLQEFDEDWTNLDLPQLDLSLSFDGSGQDAELPLDLEIGGYRFDLSISVLNDSAATGFNWVREAERATSFCDE